MKKVTLTCILCSSALFSLSNANAAPYIVNIPLNEIETKFDNVITTTSTSVLPIQVVAGQNVYEYIDKDGNAATLTVTAPDGSTSKRPFGTYGDMSGSVWGISPARKSEDPIPGYYSGLTFTFSSPVNAFGFEVGDWSTCCRGNARPGGIVDAYGVPATGTGLWISFDGGAATLPANALTAQDNPGYPFAPSPGTYTNFIGAIDSTGDFSSITFFGDGFGEYLVAGGTLRFASVPLGSVNEGGAVPSVPEPETYAMFLAGLAVLGMTARRRKQNK
ncbi:MAG: PEP-CTERM sorting domain-containing protein [Azoarcus sp.]|nr:PEP-CTERM sorting domain-containing protein [Azoarcus sp.]